MRLLVTATTFPRWKGDTEPAFVYFLSQRLMEKGFDVTVLAPMAQGAKRYEQWDGMRIRRFSYFFGREALCYDGGIMDNMKKSPIARLQPPFLVASECSAMRKIISQERPDIVHAHWIVPQGVCAALFRHRCRIVSTAHAGDVFPLRSSVWKAVARFALKRSDRVTANSTYTKRALQAIADVPVEIIPMGVDLSVFSPKKMSSAVRQKYRIEGEFILSVGRLAEKKGIAYLIRAMPAVLKEFPAAKLLIVGDGPEYPSLAALVKALGLGKSIIFAGKVENRLLPEYYASADLFVCPSIVTRSGDTEGLGVVLLESIASGTPVVASNVGGIPDIVKDRETGLLVEQKDHTLLAGAIIRLLSNRTRGKRLVAKGAEHIKKNYDWDIVACRFTALLEQLS